MEKNIAVLSGDGIGPEIIKETLKVFAAIENKFSCKFNYKKAVVGGIAIDETGNPLPDETIDICKSSDAVLFGAIGDPKYDLNPNAKVRPEQGLLKLRKSLGLFANVRPVKSFSQLYHASPLKEELIKDIDLVIFRELTGGIYFGEKKRTVHSAIDVCEYTSEEISRIAKMAFETAQNRSRKKLTLVDKANVLETSRLWRDEVMKISKNYPDVEFDLMFVDNAAMQLIQFPKQFDVILTENMFGDILTDESSVITGSLGMLPSASVGNKVALFEPIHGSYPQATGKNIANPMATLLAGAMMLEHIDMSEAAKKIEEGVHYALKNKVATIDIYKNSKYGTSDVGNYIANFIKG